MAYGATVSQRHSRPHSAVSRWHSGTHAVATNGSAKRILGDEVLAAIARDLVRAVRADVAVDWTIREQVQAKLRSKVKRLLARYGCPPDAEPRAIELVLEQTKTFAEEWAS
jgi:type I restriction enzyme R subunit